jgi:branched-chain amino acid aminotransferase
MKVHFLNGKLISEEELTISPRDLGFLRGYAIFEFLKTYPHHRPFKLDEHIDRLFQSAELIGLQLPWDKDQVKKWILETLEANQTPEEKFIKIMLSGGVSSSMLPTGEPTIIILIDSATMDSEEAYAKGFGITTVKYERYEPAAKTNNYIEGVKQIQKAAKVGAVEPLYYSDTQVFEGSNSNVFAVINNELVTPATNILFGVTRAVLLEILKLDVPIVVRNFTLRELLTASEIFYTGSGKEVVPITKIDGEPVGDGLVGSVTKEVMRQYREYTLSDKW